MAVQDRALGQGLLNPRQPALTAGRALLVPLPPALKLPARRRKRERFPGFGGSLRSNLDGVAPKGSVTVVERPDRIETIAAEWDSLADRLDAPPFLRPGWADAWWRAFGAGTLEVVAVRRAGRLAAVVPLQRRGGVLTSLSNWHTPQFGAVGEDQLALRELAAALFSSGARRTTLAFLDPGGTDTQAWLAAAHTHRRRLLVRTLERPPYLDLDGNWEDYEAQRPGKLRRDLDRRLRLLEQEGSVSVDVSDGSERLDELLAEGFRVEGSGWKSERGTAIESRPETRSFYTEVARSAASAGWLRLAFLRLDSRPVAFQYGLESGGCYYFLKGGFDSAYLRFAPGKLLLRAMLERSFASGLSRFDFGGGDEAFKSEWTDASRELIRLDALASSAPGLAEWAAFAYARPLARWLLALRP
jgi:CelD/BcsL family acetyltransferase involved in cellulose biosynthesis